MANARAVMMAVKIWEKAARPAAACIGGGLSLCLSVLFGLGLVEVPPPRVIAAAAFFGAAGALFSAGAQLSK